MSNRKYIKILFVTENGSTIEINDLPPDDLSYFLEVFNKLRIRVIQEQAKLN